MVVVDASPFDLENNCTLYQGDFAGAGSAATISYDMGGTRACEAGNNNFGLHLCETVVFENTRLTGTLAVNTTNDDDLIGLVWGAQDSSNYYSMTWKQGTQPFPFGCTLPSGIVVKRVEAPDFDSLTGADVYCPADTTNSTLLLSPAETTTAGWGDNESYTAVIDFTPTGSTVTVTRDSDGTQITTFAVDDTTFTSGFFGSTTVSQDNACVGPLFGSCL